LIAEVHDRFSGRLAIGVIFVEMGVIFD
jgi:hypothetical protein